MPTAVGSRLSKGDKVVRRGGTSTRPPVTGPGEHTDQALTDDGVAHPSMTRRVGVLTVWRNLRPYLGGRRVLFTLSAFSLLAGLAQAALLVMVGQLAVLVGTERSQSLGPFDDIGSQTLFLIAFVLVLVLAALQLGTAHVSAKMSAQALQRLRNRLAHAFSNASWDIKALEREGHLQEQLSNHSFQISMAVMGFGGLVAAALNVVALLGVALVVSPTLAVVLLAGGALLSAALRPVLGVLRRASAQSVRANLQYAGSVAESVRLAQELVVFDAGEEFERRLRASAASVTPWLYRARLLQRLIPDTFRTTAISLVVIGLWVVDTTDAARVASLAVVVLLAIRAVSYTREVQSGIAKMHDMYPYLSGVSETLDAYRIAARPSGGKDIQSIDRLELSHATYSYQPDAIALHDVDLAMQRGEAIGVVGPSGSGKSTLFQILLRLREVDRGTYLVNGIDASTIENSAWFRRIALVHQDLQLMDGTIAENIAFFRPDVSREQIEDAARRAHVHDEIVGMADGFDTRVEGIRGGLSGGQRQRICLARALIGDPDVIFLDEPTSALDAGADAMVIAAVRELKERAIVFVISHRPSTLDSCDRIVVLRDGRVVDCGSPSEVHHSNAFYRQQVGHSENREREDRDPGQPATT